VLTGGFGLFGSGDEGAGGGKQAAQSKPQKVEVSILNATQEEAADGTEIAAVSGLADKVAKDVVHPLKEFKIAAKTGSPTGFETTTIMFEPEHQDEADDLAAGVSDQLGEPDVTPMVADIRAAAKGAPLTLVIGKDNADFGSQ
jgi:hypothetical protein